MKIQDASRLARQLLDRHGLPGWRISWNWRWKWQGGSCDRVHHVIKLARKVVLVNNEAGVRELILHEIAHALTDGGHNVQWRKVARAIGCSGKMKPEIDWPVGRWTLFCFSCGVMWPKEYRPKRRLSCKECGKRQGVKGFDPRFLLYVIEGRA